MGVLKIVDLLGYSKLCAHWVTRELSTTLKK